MKEYIIRYLSFLVLLLIYYALVKFKITRKLDLHMVVLGFYFIHIGDALFHDEAMLMLFVVTNFIFVELVINIFITHKDGNNSKKKWSKGKRKV